MISKEKLIKFLQAKDAKLKDVGCTIDYFTSADAESIRNWDSKTAKSVWKIIKENDNLKGFGNMSCPFCIKNDMNCDVCEYQKNGHGYCGLNFSYNINTYAKLCNWIKVNELSIFHSFDTTFYRNLIKEIENER